jgi:hypothetical protein
MKNVVAIKLQRSSRHVKPVFFPQTEEAHSSFENYLWGSSICGGTKK